MNKGRPTKYNKEICEKAIDYIFNYKEKYHDEIPMVEGLALELGVHRDTINDWSHKHDEFSDIVKILKTMQGRVLTNGALNGTLKEKSATLCLSSQHGWITKTEHDITSSDQSFIPNIIELVPAPFPKNFLEDAEVE